MDYYDTLGISRGASATEIKKKQMYDQFGTADPQQQGFNYTGNMADINEVFSQMFGQGGGPFGDMFGQQTRRQSRNKTLNINYELTLEEAYKGKSIVFEVPLPSGRKQTIDTRMPPGITWIR